MYGKNFVLTLFTNDPGLARRADEAGINRIGLDLERIGKADRQGGLGTWVSDHRISQLSPVREALNRAELFVRTNPVHNGLQREIDELTALGAKVLMLPMFETAASVAQFVDFVQGRARVSLLLETPAAAARAHEIVRIPGIDEIHIGLNDLRLGMRLQSHFEFLVSDLMDSLAKTILDAGLPLGFGGVGRADDRSLPIHPDLVFAQYARLRADRALVSRVFTSPDPEAVNIAEEVHNVRDRLEYWHRQDAQRLADARDDLRQLVSGKFSTSV